MLVPLIEKLVRHEDLTATEAAAAMHEVMEGRVPPAALAALLTALVMKGERPAEIVGFARSMREHSVPLSAPVSTDVREGQGRARTLLDFATIRAGPTGR